MRRMPIPVRPKPFLLPGCPRRIYAGLASLSEGCPPDRGRLHTCYSPVRRSPAGEASFSPAAPRLACVKPAASVHPEPGSNSPLFIVSYIFFQFCVCLGLRIPLPASTSYILLKKSRLNRRFSLLCSNLVFLSLLLVSCGNLVIVLGVCSPSLREASFPKRECKVTAFLTRVQVFTELFR